MIKITKDLPVERILSRQMKLWESTYREGRIEDRPALPCITISREVGSLGRELAERLAERTSWQVFDKELVEYIAGHAHVRKEMVEIFDHKTQSELDTWIVTLLTRHALSSDKYFKHLVTTILSIGQHGHAIILGRGANFIIPDHRALKIKLVAPEPRRIQNVMQDQRINEEEALKFIKQADRERAAFMRRFFHQEQDLPTDYDLVLNSGKLPLEQITEIVMHALHAKFAVARA